MPGPEHQDELTDPSDTAVAEMDEMIREFRRDDRSFAARLAETGEEITTAVERLGLRDYHSEPLDRAQNGVVENPGEAIADSGEDAAAVIEAMRKKLAKLSMQLAKAPTSAQNYNLALFLGIFSVLSTSAAIASLLYNAIHAAQHDDPAPVELPPDTDAKVRELIRQWNAQSDDNYWNDLATYVGLTDVKVPLTLADQVLFMNYTIDLSPAAAAWIWDSGQDVVDRVDLLIAAYRSAGTTAAMYRRATALSYRGRPIPRAVTAGLLRMALSQIVVLKPPHVVAFPALPGEPGGEDRLSEPPDDERGEIETEAEQARRDEASFAGRLRETAAQVTRTIDRLDASTLNCEAAEAAWNRQVEVADSAIADPAPDARLNELMTRLETLTAASAQSSTPSKWHSCSRYLAAFFGITVLGAGAVVLVEYLSRTANGEPTDDITSIPPDTLEQIRELVEKWKDQPDRAYWDSLASYVDKNEAAVSRLDQIVFMNYTIQLCPPAQPFLWDSAADKASIADQLVTAAKGGTDLPGMYRQVTTLRYHHAPLPRAVAADVLRLALGWLAPAHPRAPVVEFSSSATSIALSVAGTLVWAMPPPWGPIAAGGITLIQLLFAGDGKSDQFGQAVRELEQFIEHRDVNADATHIKAFADWCDGQSETLALTQADNSAYITSTLLPELRRMVAPGDESVYEAIYDLEQHLDVPGALDILVLGATVYLLALKMIVQLDAQLAASARTAGDDAEFASYTALWLADYSNFVLAVDGYSSMGTSIAGWAARIVEHVDADVTARLTKISGVYRYDNGHWQVVVGGGGTGVSRYWVQNLGWTYRDDGAGDTDTTNFIGDGDIDGRPLEYEQLANQRRDEHAQSVGQQLDAQHGDTLKTVKKWQASILQWNEHQPPRPPTTAVTVTWTDPGVPARTADGPAVSYAVAFANEAGPSQPGPWSAPVATTPAGHATLSGLPTDALHQATHLWLYRRGPQADGSLGTLIIDIVTAKATGYTDSKR